MRGTHACDFYSREATLRGKPISEVFSCPRRCGGAVPAVIGTRPKSYGDAPVSDQRRDGCRPVAADPVDQRGERTGVLPLCRDDPWRNGSRGYGRDAADVVSGGAATSRADRLRAAVDEGRRPLAVYGCDVY